MKLLEKLNGVLGLLPGNGLKTVVGLLLSGLALAAPQLAPLSTPEFVDETMLVLGLVTATVGAVHKLIKMGIALLARD